MNNKVIYGHGKVGRNVTISHCNGQRLNSHDTDTVEFVDYSFDVYGCYTTERATRFARRITGDTSIVINNVEHETSYYCMDLETFIRYAERTN